MKILGWIIGLPAIMFVILMILQWGNQRPQTVFGTSVEDCKAAAREFVISDPARAVRMQSECDAISKPQPNPGKVYGPNGWEK